MSWLNPNADPLPEDPAALHALSKTIERFLEEAVERAEDVEQREQRDAERREKHRRAVELTPRIEELRAAWTKENAAQVGKKPSKTRQRKKASKSRTRSDGKIATLEKQADELVAEIHQLGIDGQGWTRATLLKDVEAWTHFVETLSLRGCPPYARLKGKAAVTLNAELVQYGVAELRPVEKPELFVELDGTDIVNRTIHGEGAIPIVVGRARLEAARAGAEELLGSVAPTLEASNARRVSTATDAPESITSNTLDERNRQSVIQLARDYRWFRVDGGRYELPEPLPKVIGRLHVAGRGLRNAELNAAEAIEFRIHKYLHRGPLQAALRKLITIEAVPGKRGYLYGLAAVELVDAESAPSLGAEAPSAPNLDPMP